MQNKRLLSIVLTFILILLMFPNSTVVQAAQKQAIIPKVGYVKAPTLEYTAGDIVNFDLHAPNYGGRVQYRVVLWDDNKKEARDLWTAGDRYYQNWMPYGNNTFNLHWRIDEPGSYRITVYVKRAELANSKAYLKGQNCDSYLESQAFVVKSKVSVLDKDGQAYGSADQNKMETYSNDVNITGKSVAFNNAEVKENLTVTGDNAVIKNVNVTGKILIDPGKDGSCTLNNVTANAIEVLSGGQNSIHIINSSADTMNVGSQSPVRVEVDGDTEILSTTASGYVIFDRKNGTYGTITITKDENDETVVEFRGEIKDKIEVKTAATIRTGTGSSVANLVINTESNKEIVKLEGQYDKVELITETKLEVAANTKVGSIIANNNAVIKLNNTAVINNVEKRGNEVIIEREGEESVTPPEDNGGGYVPPTVAVSAINPITGTAKVGVELTAGTLTPSAATVSYQWKICNTVDGTYDNIIGATTKKYTPVAGDVGKYIKVSATGTGSYTGTVTSVATATVAPAEPAAVTYASTGTLTNTTVSVAYGTIVDDAIAALDTEVGVVGSLGETGIASIAWTIASYDGAVAGDYTATGVLTLPAGWTGTAADVTATITVNNRSSKTNVNNNEELRSAILDDLITEIIITGSVDLSTDLTVDKSISIGEGGELKTNGYTITIPMNSTLNINEGYLVISKNKENSGLNGKVVNNGTIAVAENGCLRIEQGGILGKRQINSVFFTSPVPDSINQYTINTGGVFYWIQKLWNFGLSNGYQSLRSRPRVV